MADERLLLPATRALVEGWCGPVVVRGLSPFHDGPAVLLGPREPSARAGDWLVYLLHDVEEGCEVASVSPDEIRLDLSRAECRDRVWRVVVAALGSPVDRPEVTHDEDGLVILAGDLRDEQAQMYVWDRQGRPAGAARLHVPALADLDPDDDTRLPDGSRLVDALALALVAKHTVGAS